jgi:hypothetical protein
VPTQASASKQANDGWIDSKYKNKNYPWLPASLLYTRGPLIIALFEPLEDKPK